MNTKNGYDGYEIIYNKIKGREKVEFIKLVKQ